MQALVEASPPPAVSVDDQKALAKSKAKAKQKKKDTALPFFVKKNKRKEGELWAIHQKAENGRQIVQIKVSIAGAKEKMEDVLNRLNAGTCTVDDAKAEVNALKA